VEGKDLVGVGAAVGLRVGVDERDSEAGDDVQRAMLGVDGDLVGLDAGDGGVNDDFAFGSACLGRRRESGDGAQAPLSTGGQ
jgi:hypothetical protein